VRLEVEGDAPPGPENLCARAARAFLEAAPDADASIRLRKRIPPASGLGGGSSDAAAVLRLLARLLPSGPDAERVEAIARTLGADVPYFLRGGAAVGRDRGDRLEPIEGAASFEAVLILPPFGCETVRVFQEVAKGWRRAPAGGLERAIEALQSGRPERLRAAHHNGLALPALRAYPRLSVFTREVERRLGRPPLLSGSGSTLYEIPDAGDVERTLGALDGLEGARLVVRA
jgi:4-diphosphocytidyl-2-C-methyl-D-erythritol kinase